MGAACGCAAAAGDAERMRRRDIQNNNNGNSGSDDTSDDGGADDEGKGIRKRHKKRDQNKIGGAANNNINNNNNPQAIKFTSQPLHTWPASTYPNSTPPFFVPPRIAPFAAEEKVPAMPKTSGRIIFSSPGAPPPPRLLLRPVSSAAAAAALLSGTAAAVAAGGIIAAGGGAAAAAPAANSSDDNCSGGEDVTVMVAQQEYTNNNNTFLGNSRSVRSPPVAARAFLPSALLSQCVGVARPDLSKIGNSTKQQQRGGNNNSNYMSSSSSPFVYRHDVEGADDTSALTDAIAAKKNKNNNKEQREKEKRDGVVVGGGAAGDIIKDAEKENNNNHNNNNNNQPVVIEGMHLRRRMFLFPSTVTALGLFIKIDGRPVSTASVIHLKNSSSSSTTTSSSSSSPTYARATALPGACVTFVYPTPDNCRTLDATLSSLTALNKHAKDAAISASPLRSGGGGVSPGITTVSPGRGHQMLPLHHQVQRAMAAAAGVGNKLSFEDDDDFVHHHPASAASDDGLSAAAQELFHALLTSENSLPFEIVLELDPLTAATQTSTTAGCLFEESSNSLCRIIVPVLNKLQPGIAHTVSCEWVMEYDECCTFAVLPATDSSGPVFGAYVVDSGCGSRPQPHINMQQSAPLAAGSFKIVV